MELKDLVGKHVLTGVDRETKPVECYGVRSDADVFTFTLDGVTYAAIEDPDDGYRSCMKEIIPVAGPTKNVFPGCEVMCSVQDPDAEHTILELTDTTTGKVVLAVGTDWGDQWYPYFVNEWNPENMAINHGKEK